MDALVIQPLDARSPEAIELHAASWAFQIALYPMESIHLAEADAFDTPGAVFLGAFLEGKMIGTGGYTKQSEEVAELKRMFVREEARGQGIGRQILKSLEDSARSNGITLLRLETGIHQPAAIRLYESFGYTRCSRFGTYPDDPLSVFMEKRLRESLQQK